MSAVGRVLSHKLRKHFPIFETFRKDGRFLSTATSPIKEHQTQKNKSTVVESRNSRDRGSAIPPQYRFVYPEFLPDPAPQHRNALREKLERMDMMSRRTVIDIPEFYVGSILAVTHADPHAPGKMNRFVGICIDKTGCGLRASFILRNVVDHQGVEVHYDMYDPTIDKIECLRLEKRLDDKLYYLRDAPEEYSTFPFDMEAEILSEDAPVPVNPLQVPLKPEPWLQKWERHEMKGIRDINVTHWWRVKKVTELAKPWEKYDLMKTYRETIPEEEQQAIYAEIYSKLHSLEISRRKLKRKRGLIRPTKGA